MRIFSLSIILVFVVVLAAGCLKDVDAPEPTPGLDTVPFYKIGTHEFNTKAALNSRERKDVESQRQFRAAVKARVRQTGINIEIPDPWVPPVKVRNEDLPPSLRAFPKDYFGYPDWTAAVKEELIKPRASLPGEIEVKEQIYDRDILFQINDRLMANVLFPHKIHTYWLSCKICHPKIFKAKKGENNFTMYDIWNGKFCGRCHGKVAFQPKGYNNCKRCHSQGKSTMGIQ